MAGFFGFGRCRFCGEEIGWLQREHAHHRAQHDETDRQLRDLFARALTDGFTAKKLRTDAVAKAAKDFIDEAELRGLVVDEIARIIDPKVPATCSRGRNSTPFRKS
jgi:hypothetical protein